MAAFFTGLLKEEETEKLEHPILVQEEVHVFKNERHILRFKLPTVVSIDLGSDLQPTEDWRVSLKTDNVSIEDFEIKETSAEAVDDKETAVHQVVVETCLDKVEKSNTGLYTLKITTKRVTYVHKINLKMGENLHSVSLLRHKSFRKCSGCAQ